ncbi:MAG: substrate-binding domain-containing protein [Akkermansiaceae bacterium]|jgi:DNA-binding LacI/PurR family transcriptional regulator|nr:substrate-binding domain-containing protein [Akkermansiaceae bacterium]
MLEFIIHSPSEQVAAHLRGELLRRTWSGEMPGTPQLATELGTDRRIITAALDLLEKEGLLLAQGKGRRRKIVLPKTAATSALRIAILEYDKTFGGDGYTVELLHLLNKAGHNANFAPGNLLELGMNPSRVARLVNQTEADAWVVSAGSLEVLEWFSTQPVSAFALFGRLQGLPIAGTKPDKAPAFTAATRHLVGLGHRRIVLLARQERRLPVPGRSERAFLEELEAHGIRTSLPYHLPDWEESAEGFHRVLDSLYRATPPTALIIEEANLFFAAQQFLLHRGLRVPEDVSLVCTDRDPYFLWCKPSIAHIHWDSAPVVRRIVSWAANVSRGNDDRRQTYSKAEFIEGGTVGPAPR